MRKSETCPQCCCYLNVIRKGQYWRACDSRWAQKFYCKLCQKWFCEQTTKDTYRHKNTRVVPDIQRFLVSAVSQRQIARKLKTTRKTVARKITLLASRAMAAHAKFVYERREKITHFTFDEMESSEWTKCLPLSLPLVVSPERYILAMGVARIPAKGHLAKISRKKYGFRPDETPEVFDSLFSALRSIILPLEIRSDSKPSYGPLVKKYFPAAQHLTSLGGRSCIAGQGELKKKGFDPLFALNHTAAMYRDHVANLKRRSWTNTKRAERLVPLLAIYAWEHNTQIALKRKEPPPPSIFQSLRSTLIQKNTVPMLNA